MFQENNLYFSKKQYVRNDKYTLASMLRNKDIELPSNVGLSFL